MTTFKTGDGVVPGEYSIVVYPYDSPAGATRTREQMEAAAQSGAEKPKHIIPEKYSDPAGPGSPIRSTMSTRAKSGSNLLTSGN